MVIGLQSIISDVDFSSKMASIRKSLEKEYNEYVKNVSSVEMAASLETCSFICTLMHSISPQSVLNLGSGFSSYAIRKTATQTMTNNVVCVDDNIDWLEKTREYVRGKQLPTDGLMSWSDFVMSNNWEKFDLVFHDIGNMDTRAVILPLIPRILNHRNGIAILDDTHKEQYQKIIDKTFNNSPWEVLNLKEFTLDSLGRYGYGLSSKIES